MYTVYYIHMYVIVYSIYHVTTKIIQEQWVTGTICLQDFYILCRHNINSTLQKVMNVYFNT